MSNPIHRVGEDLKPAIYRFSYLLGTIYYVIILLVFGKAKLMIIFFSGLVSAYGVIGAVIEEVSAGDDAYKNLSILAEIINKIEKDYVEEPDTEEAMEGALLGMVEVLDPYSSFVDRSTYGRVRELRERFTPSPGIILSKRYGYAHVVSVVTGSSAQRQGLRPGDLLESIDGKLTSQMSLLEAQSLLLGPSGSSVQLNVIRSRRPHEVSVVREESVLLPATAKIVEDGLGVLRIFHLKKGSAEVILSKLKILRSSGVRGLIVDVRGVAQGLLEEVVQLTDFFLPRGEKILTVKDRSSTETVFSSSADPVISGIPVVVLMDHGTSGSVEVFAAALQDHKIAETVGEKTSGRGSAQESFFLEDGSVLLISTKLYQRPTGKLIQGPKLRDSGVVPDVVSPDEDFVSKLASENVSDDVERDLDHELYRKLQEAVEAEQFNAALKRLRSKVFSEAA